MNPDHNQQACQLFSEGFHFCIDILKEKNLLPEIDLPLSVQAKQLGEEMADILINYMDSLIPVESEELFLETEHMESEPIPSDESQECEPSSQNSTSSNYEPEEKQAKYTIVPLDKKIKIYNLSREHPNWTLATLQKNGGSDLTRYDELKRWKRDIQIGGTRFDKMQNIETYVYKRFCEEREKGNFVTTRHLREWALQRSMLFDPEHFNFTASIRWVNEFKKKHRISQRKITKFTKPSEIGSFETIEQSATTFQNDCRNIMSEFHRNYIFNTDQMGCEYRTKVHRTLEHTGQKIVNVNLGDMNKVTHTYTAQYTITASGKLLRTVFLCLQEPTGNFGPRVQEQVDSYCSSYKRVFATASKSGKLSSNHFRLYLDNVLKPYVADNEFLLILDSWTGQRKDDLFSGFINEDGTSTCTRKIIPPGCTALVQPLDVYLHRQIKYLLKEIQNSTHLLQEGRQISSREDIIKLHSIIVHQLSAPVFQSMIEYSWHAAGLLTDRDIFANVKDVCFPQLSKKPVCRVSSCTNIVFITCSWCQMKLCFSCFYDQFHPNNCQSYFVNV